MNKGDGKDEQDRGDDGRGWDGMARREWWGQKGWDGEDGLDREGGEDRQGKGDGMGCDGGHRMGLRGQR